MCQLTYRAFTVTVSVTAGVPFAVTEALNTTGVLAVTVVVVIENVSDVAPAGIVTETGTETAALALKR